MRSPESRPGVQARAERYDGTRRDIFLIDDMPSQQCFLNRHILHGERSALLKSGRQLDPHPGMLHPINPGCFDGVPKNLSFNVTKAKHFIDGYASIRKLTDDEKGNIKVLSQGAALRFLLTRVFDALNTVDGAIVKVKDPMEYLKRLEFHKNSKNFEDYFF